MPAPKTKPEAPEAEPAIDRAAGRPTAEQAAKPLGRPWITGVPRPLLIALAMVTFGGMLFWGIKKATAQIDVAVLMSALRATPLANIAAALASTALSYLSLVGYDVCGLSYARARAPLRTVLLASFCGFAIGNSVGLGAFSGGAVRFRLYAAAGLSPGQIARVILFISVAVGVGLAAIAGLGLGVQAAEMSHLLGASPILLRAIATILLALAVGFLVACASRQAPLRSGSINIDPPRATLMLTQIVFTAIDVLAATTTLWMLLPAVGMSFFAFVAIYAAALALGALSHIPGGLGVFDLAILYAVGGNTPASTVAAALVAYRAIYYLVPLLLSTVLLARFELRHSLKTLAARLSGRK